MLHGSCVYCHKKKDEHMAFCIVTGEYVDAFEEAKCPYHNKQMESGFHFFSENNDETDKNEKPKRKRRTSKKTISDENID